MRLTAVCQTVHLRRKTVKPNKDKWRYLVKLFSSSNKKKLHPLKTLATYFHCLFHVSKFKENAVCLYFTSIHSLPFDFPLCGHSETPLRPPQPLRRPVLYILRPCFLFETSLHVSAAPKARFVARRKDSVTVLQLQRPLSEYMSLPASQYSVLDAERIERVDEETFRCYVYRFKFFAFEVCPVLIVRVEVEDDGCSIKLLSCKLEGSPIVVAQNDKFDASMTNRITCSPSQNSAAPSRLTSDAVIKINIEIPFAFRAIPKEAIESTRTQILDQILKMMLPRFMSQLVKDYQAWASGDTSRQPLGAGKI